MTGVYSRGRRAGAGREAFWAKSVGEQARPVTGEGMGREERPEMWHGVVSELGLALLKFYTNG